MDRLTRKELKQDRFAVEVEHTVGFLAEHRDQAVRIGIAAGIVLVLVLGLTAWRRHQHGVRQEALTAALAIQNAPIGDTGNPYLQGYPSAAERDKAATKAFTDLAAKYSGSDEGAIGRYYLGILAADQGRTADAEKNFREAIDQASANYASLAKLSLADLYAGEGKTKDAEQLLQSLVNKPTDFVSKDQATVALAELIGETRPAEARKLLEPLRTERSAVSRAAITALSSLPTK